MCGNYVAFIYRSGVVVALPELTRDGQVTQPSDQPHQPAGNPSPSPISRSIVAIGIPTPFRSPGHFRRTVRHGFAPGRPLVFPQLKDAQRGQTGYEVLHVRDQHKASVAGVLGVELADPMRVCHGEPQGVEGGALLDGQKEVGSFGVAAPVDARHSEEEGGEGGVQPVAWVVLGWRE
ncbi:hypothetical protein MMC13_006937 [Lambiella insularis]|nr:hypothetical protein [Lambiella insularis]